MAHARGAHGAPLSARELEHQRALELGRGLEDAQRGALVGEAPVNESGPRARGRDGGGCEQAVEVVDAVGRCVRHGVGGDGASVRSSGRGCAQALGSAGGFIGFGVMFGDQPPRTIDCSAAEDLASTRAFPRNCWGSPHAEQTQRQPKPQEIHSRK